jgi:Escherichia/Staphylococcus phage prohead protease
MSLLLKRLELAHTELKLADNGKMIFSGYASVFGGVDSYGDTIAPGAYAKTLKKRERPIRMRWNHYGPVIGKWLQMLEDKKGLWVEGELTPGHSTASDVYASMKHEAIDGMSIGYRVRDQEPINAVTRLLKEIELVEISVVEEPADLAARISDVKSAIEDAATLREIEAALRDSGGFSRADACMLVSRIKSLTRGELEAEAKQSQEISALFQNFLTVP